MMLPPVSFSSYGPPPRDDSTFNLVKFLRYIMDFHFFFVVVVVVVVE